MPDNTIQCRIRCQLEILHSKQLTALRFSGEAILCIKSCSTKVVYDHYEHKPKALQCIYAAINYLVVALSLLESAFPRQLVTNYSTTMKSNGINEKDPKDFIVI